MILINNKIIMENLAFNNIITRRSVRDFTGEVIKKEDLISLLKAGMSAPSAVNRQPWSFVVVEKKETLEALSEKLTHAKMLSKSGAAIVVCGLPDKSKIINSAIKAVSGISLGDYWITDCSAASENILLAAHALNLGAVWTAVFPNEELVGTVRKILAIPDDVIPLNVIPIGVPADLNIPPIDKFKEKNIHWGKW
jgi:nitroreductase